MVKNKKRIIWIIAIIVVIGGVIFLVRGRKPEVQYITEEVKRGDVKQTVSVTGELVPKDRIDLTFELAGQVTFIGVDVGDEVKKGQLIAKIDNGGLVAQLHQAQEDLKVQQEALDLARRDWNNLKPEEKATKKATVRKAEAAVQGVREQLSKTSLYAPISGIISKRNVDVGENVTPGSALVSGSTAVVTIMKDNDFKIEANVPESDIVIVEVGQEAILEFDALEATEKFEAEVSTIEPSSTTIQDVVYYAVEFEMNELDDRFKAGMSIDIDISTNEKKDVLVIPSRAVNRTNGSVKVQILSDEEEVEEREIKIGLRGDDGEVEVISGLSAGEKVVTFVEEE